MSFIKSKVHKTVCGQPLVTTLSSGAILTQFCIIKKSAGEHEIHTDMNGIQWQENKKVEVVEQLGFGKCRLSIAVGRNEEYSDVSFLHGKRIAT